ncbi:MULTISPECIES: iron-sulfur cluster carrier protein ApbC [Pandoraea]|uniref:iron-sulfur cluster carrier protein ApbC n=1 Tax=Pandoraea TaxID=93217 RepID=UPI002103DE0A|nr:MULTISPECIES: iron-sulfur cluster carrier protein ApbC [Pandoraea]
MPGLSRRASTERETQMEVAQINEVLRGIVDPDTGLDLIAGKYVKQVVAEHGHVGIQIEFGYPAKSQFEAMRTRITDAVGKLPGVERVAVDISQKIVAHAVQRGVKLLPNVKNIVAVASGKGGVGKSTTAVNLALALVAEGATVGILDADIYGPSLPTLLGIHGKPESKDGKTLEPMTAHGLQASSIGFLIEPDNPMVWRGPMVTQALEQLLNQTNWHDLDYLIVDMPPGTGDIQLTLAQKVPVTGAVIVTTPQDLALLDARKGLKMFEKVGVPILGLIENMSLHICSNCGHEEPIFGVGGGERMSHDFDVELLGKLPLEMSIRVHADAGMPSVVGDPDGRVAALYKAIARKMAVKIAARQKDMTSKFPSIVVQNT